MTVSSLRSLEVRRELLFDPTYHKRLLLPKPTPVPATPSQTEKRSQHIPTQQKPNLTNLTKPLKTTSPNLG